MSGEPPIAAVLAADPGFGPANLPYGVFSAGASGRRVGMAIGDAVLDLARFTGDDVFAQPNLNGFMSQGRERWQAVRTQVQSALAGQPADVLRALVPRSEVTLHLPIDVADFVDFFSSLEHATNAAAILRPGQPPLEPNWRELPVGYHGRAGTVVASGTEIVRPRGQLRGEDGRRPSFAPTRALDIEAELGFVVGVGSEQFRAVSTDDFEQHVFGVVLLIDWSARDIQAYEYRPLGPFLAKSFATTISPWVVPLDALAHAHAPSPQRDREPLPYLREAQPWSLDIDMVLRLQGAEISRPNTASLYWTGAQQMAHMTVNGASLRTGDLYGSGTVSSFDTTAQGSLLEITRGGTQPLTLPGGETRGYLLDGDIIELEASARGPGGTRISLGSATGKITGASA
jgi:fumarylacetoacetase